MKDDGCLKDEGGRMKDDGCLKDEGGRMKDEFPPSRSFAVQLLFCEEE
jgi:hypothetical protein